MPKAIIESGTPRELAERFAQLPDGQYEVVVRRIRSRDEALSAFDRIARDIRENPDPAIAGKSDDEVMDMVNAILDEEKGQIGTRV